jgi:Fe-S-cluster-containing dehydrogenase component
MSGSGRWGRSGGTAPGVTRRGFLRAGLLAGGAGGALLLAGRRSRGEPLKRTGTWQGFAVDLTKCIGCGACVRACQAENDVPDGFFRTWVERYTVLRDGQVLVDSPEGARNGFTGDPPIGPEASGTRGSSSSVAKSFFVPKLCNHCEDSPCVQVCPVGATYMTPDGVVLIDRKHCVGCGYCVQACPYGCRYIHPQHGYADKCSLCYHRTTKGLKPACVAACPVGARVFGDLHDAQGPLRKILDVSRYGVLKPHLGTHPKCFYLGLGQEVI